jgi:hypothetical protein
MDHSDSAMAAGVGGSSVDTNADINAAAASADVAASDHSDTAMGNVDGNANSSSDSNTASAETSSADASNGNGGGDDSF